MNFASLEFFAFFALVFVGYWLLGRKHQTVLLLLSSWFFYACWDWRFLGLIIVCILSNYYCGQRIYLSNRSTTRKAWLWLAIAINLSVLGYFKYAGFMVDSLTALLASMDIQVSQVTLSITLPVGISFYIFQGLSYSLDIYRRQLRPDHSLLDFATFVSFFPQLVAGPIVRAKEFLYQLEESRRFNSRDFEQGAIRFLTGYFKKVFIADNLAVHLVDPVFAEPSAYSSAVLWLAMFGYAVQIYADFSGYSNMAIGCARMLGFRLPENFNFPYLATSFSEFWRRWHMTMSRFFRDYVYISLGGNRHGAVRTTRNLAATTLISGLWHGASWTFVCWGGLHGLYIAANHVFDSARNRISPGSPGSSGATKISGWIITQLLVCFAWILFRSADFGDARVFFGRLFSGDDGQAYSAPAIVYICFAAFFVDHLYGYLAERGQSLRLRFSGYGEPLAYAAMLVLLVHGKIQNANPFIYFQF